MKCQFEKKKKLNKIKDVIKKKDISKKNDQIMMEVSQGQYTVLRKG